jgi:hypothetical protein
MWWTWLAEEVWTTCWAYSYYGTSQQQGFPSIISVVMIGRCYGCYCYCWIGLFLRQEQEWTLLFLPYYGGYDCWCWLMRMYLCMKTWTLSKTDKETNTTLYTYNDRSEIKSRPKIEWILLSRLEKCWSTTSVHLDQGYYGILSDQCGCIFHQYSNQDESKKAGSMIPFKVLNMISFSLVFLGSS